MNNKHEPSNFELKQEILKLEHIISYSKNVEELKQNQTVSKNENICFWTLVILFLVCLFVVLIYSAQSGFVKFCTTLMPVFSFFIGVILPDIRHKL